MDMAIAAVVIAGMALGFTILNSVFGGGWKLSGRLSSIEATESMDKNQTTLRLTSIEGSLIIVQLEIKKLTDVLIKLAEMRGDYNLLDQRITASEQRQVVSDRVVDDLRRGRGWVQSDTRDGSLDGEYSHKK